MTDRPRRRAVGTARWAALPCTLVVLFATLATGASPAGAAGGPAVVQPVSTDPLVNTPTVPPGIHHATEVETDSLSNGSTIVSSFQVGRFSSYGGAATGWATSTDAGVTWQHGLLPGLSAASPSPNNAYIGVANQSVLYDTKHGSWLIPTVADVDCSLQAPASKSCIGHVATEHTLMVNSSSDGVTWNLPVTAVASNVDKPWGVCDNSPVSPHYGTCYVAYAQIDDSDRIALVHTTDGGLTWSAPVTTPSNQSAYNTNPVVQPNGRLVIVATDDTLNGGNNSQLLSFVSNDGGATLSDAATGSGTLQKIQYHTPAGGIRGKNKPSVDVDSSGKIYAAWADCRFRPGCTQNDIVYATSTDGVNFSFPPTRVAADPLASTVDHFIPGFAVRPGTSGTSAELGVVSYSYPTANCTSLTCQLNVLFSSSIDGGATWSTQQLNSTPMQLSWLAPTGLGPAVGDYESVSYADGHAVTVFPLAQALVSGAYTEGESAATLPWAGGSTITATAGSGQTAAVSTSFGAPLKATVVDAVTGAPVAGATVTFAAPPAGASGTFAGGATSATATTDGSGVATAPTYTADGTAGTELVTASTSGGSTQYMLANAGAPATITLGVGTSSQGAPVNTTFATPLTATVFDANGTPVPGASVDFTAPPSGVSGTFASPGTGATATVSTDAFGVATAPDFTADGTTGTYSVTVTAGSASGSYQLTNTSSAPASIVVLAGDSQSTVVGTTFATALSVQVLDGAGQPYPGTTVTFTTPLTKASATFVSSGTNTTQIRTDASGVATVPITYAAAGAGTYAVSVAAGAAGATMHLTNSPGPATSITVIPLTNNQSQLVNQPFGSALMATVKDALGNPIIGDSVTFAAPLSGPSGTFSPGGPLAVVAASATGVATSPIFTANATAGTYQVSATAASTAVTQPSISFTMTNTLAPTITSAPATTFGLGVPNAFSVTTTGNPVPALTEVGTLPPGVSFVDNGDGTAALSGTPSSTGTFPISIGADNSWGTAAQQSFVLSVDVVPAVTGISPASGPSAGGTSVTVTGTGFTGATGVSFGATPATSFTVNSDTDITATAPAGTGTADVMVTAPGGTSPTSPADAFAWVAPPTVTGISPAAGPLAGGTSVSITGTGFTGTTGVSFGASPATSFTVNSDTSITATAPAGAGTGDVVVTATGGASAPTVGDVFTWMAAPIVSGINPASGPTVGGTSVTITGTGFTGATGVSFGGTPATSFTVNSDTDITATAPAGTGNADVVVTNPGGMSGTSSADTFTWVLVVAVSGIAPAAGPTGGGTTVTITGAAFTGATAVSFGATPATSFTVDSDTQITATAPAGTGTGDVVVTAPGGTSAMTSADVFTWVPAPVVTGISPASGPATGGTMVTLTGTGFAGATGVSFGSAQATSFTVNSDTSITATAPAGTGTGDVVVTAVGGVSATSQADVFTWVPTPVVTGINPASGPIAGGTLVTITGTGFNGATGVSFGSTPATSFTAVSDTTITATAPAGSGTVDVMVSSVGGTSATSSADQFTWVAVPTVSVVSPAAGPTGGGIPVTITGTGFTGATAVDFGATPATFTVQSATTITATAPAGSGAADIVVTTAGGQSVTSAADVFTWMAAPTVSSVSPTFGPSAGGTTVLISGTGFTGATSVGFGNTGANFSIVSDTSITAVSPAGSGLVDVTVTSPGGASITSALDRFTFVAPPGPPTGVVATAGHASATISWTPPVSNGGSPITGYTVTSSPGVKHCATTTATTCTISGLTNGTTYRFTVTAANVVSTGPASAQSNAVVPAGSVPVPTNGTLSAPIVGMAALPNGLGYWLVNANGVVSGHGFATTYGSMAGHTLNSKIAHIVATPTGKGYWLVAGDGGTFAFGDAGFYGSMGGHQLNRPVVDLAPTPSGKGYWLVASDGGIFAFGDAQFRGSMGGSPLNQPVVGIAVDTTTQGYWLVASDGGIFAFGAPFFGSTGAQHLNQPVNGMSVTANDGGYWFVASDGGIFAFGNAGFFGSAGGGLATAPVVGMASDYVTGGYWLVDGKGHVYGFNAPFYGNN